VPRGSKNKSHLYHIMQYTKLIKYSKKNILSAFRIWFLTIIPVGIPLCAIIGLMYGIKNKDTIFTKCSAVALFVGIACIVYTLLVIKST